MHNCSNNKIKIKFLKCFMQPDFKSMTTNEKICALKKLK